MSRGARAAQLADGLFNIGALKLGDFLLSSGKRSRYYLDLRLIPSHPEVYRLALECYREMADEVGLENFDSVGGVATSGLTISSPLAVFLEKPMLYVRREGKEHGTRRLLEGDVAPGSRVLLVDDLATTGGSLAEAVAALREGGLVVADALVLVDRLEGAGERLSGIGVKLRSFVTFQDLAASMQEQGRASEAYALMEGRLAKTRPEGNGT